jgi:uncharacterized protein YheU (UPF0270 family)
MAKFYTGRDGRMLLGESLVVKVTSWSLQADLEILETTTLGDSLRSFTPGVQSYSGTANILYYKDDSGNISTTGLLNKLIKTGTDGVSEADTVQLTLRLRDGTDYGNIDRNDVTMNAYVTSVSISSSVGEVVSAQISFQTTGALITASM